MLTTSDSTITSHLSSTPSPLSIYSTDYPSQYPSTQNPQLPTCTPPSHLQPPISPLSNPSLTPNASDGALEPNYSHDFKLHAQSYDLKLQPQPHEMKLPQQSYDVRTQAQTHDLRLPTQSYDFKPPAQSVPLKFPNYPAQGSQSYDVKLHCQSDFKFQTPSLPFQQAPLSIHPLQPQPHLRLPSASTLLRSSPNNNGHTNLPCDPLRYAAPYLPTSPLTPPAPKSSTISTRAIQKKNGFSCSICNKTFGKKNHVARHVSAVHLNVRPWVCGICGFPFQEKRGLGRHLKVHEKSRGERVGRCVASLTTGWMGAGVRIGGRGDCIMVGNKMVKRHVVASLKELKQLKGS